MNASLEILNYTFPIKLVVATKGGQERSWRADDLLDFYTILKEVTSHFHINSLVLASNKIANNVKLALFNYISPNLVNVYISHKRQDGGASVGSGLQLGSRQRL